jgi:hypothetical protein
MDNQPGAPSPSKLFPIIMIFVVIVGGSALGLFAGLELKHHTGLGGSQTGTSCGSEACFESKFHSCSPATYSASLAQLAAVKYRINGKHAVGCNMTFEYTSNPNKAWVNQPMTCDFDNTKGLEAAVAAAFTNLKAYKCSGPLVGILQALGPISPG